MKRVLKIALMAAGWLALTLSDGLVSAWFPVRGIEDPPIGAGFEMLFGAVIGLLFCAMLGFVVLAPLVSRDEPAFTLGLRR